MVFYVNFAYSMQRGDVELTEIQPDTDDGGYETDDGEADIESGRPSRGRRQRGSSRARRHGGSSRGRRNKELESIQEENEETIHEENEEKTEDECCECCIIM
uniref:Uncharacterized protein n=1 Tax=Meloidogyne enterolobii TaxID=390850 RepID=A0A6V7WRK8_MELEN|nr:unnamed protein product [Meloidogyne enterolobii]